MWRLLCWTFLLLGAACGSSTHRSARLYYTMVDAVLVGQAGLGTLELSTTVLISPGSSEIVYLPSVLQRSWSYNPEVSADYVYIGADEGVFVRIREATEAEQEILAQHQADGILGVSVGSPLGWHWRFIRLTAASMTLTNEPCDDCPALRSCAEPTAAIAAGALPGVCVLDSVSFFGPLNGGFQTTSAAIEAVRTGQERQLRVGAWRFEPEIYAPFTNDDQQQHFWSVGPNALSTRALLQLHVIYDMQEHRIGVLDRPCRVRPPFTIPVLTLAAVVALFVWLTLDSNHLARIEIDRAPLSDSAVASGWLLCVLAAVAVLAVTQDPYLPDLLRPQEQFLLWTMVLYSSVCAAVSAYWTLTLPSMTKTHPDAVVTMAVECGGWATAWLLQALSTRGAWTNILQSLFLLLFIVFSVRALIANWLLSRKERQRPLVGPMSFFTGLVTAIAAIVGLSTVFFPFVDTLTPFADSQLALPIAALLVVALFGVLYVQTRSNVVAARAKLSSRRAA
jgi:hypothetical protein